VAANLEQLEIILTAQMEQTIRVFAGEVLTRLETMAASGMSRPAALAVIEADKVALGRTFGAYKNGMKNLVLNAIRGAVNEGMFDVYNTAGIELFRWVTVSGNPCPQCDGRQGDVLTMAGWIAAGLPKSGFSVCMDNCKCVLLPEGFESSEIAKAGFFVKL
jgi:hypothetical protein